MILNAAKATTRAGIEIRTIKSVLKIFIKFVENFFNHVVYVELF